MTIWKQCAEGGCMVAIPKGQPRCAKHTKKSGWIENPSKSNRERNVSARPWSRVRRRVMDRDYYTCQVCANVGKIRTGTEVDHIRNDGDDSMDNLQTICVPCHRAKTNAESVASRAMGGD
jgi:5-methylcytosine-specific restriction protein A